VPHARVYRMRAAELGTLTSKVRATGRIHLLQKCVQYLVYELKKEIELYISGIHEPIARIFEVLEGGEGGV
jgi:hypothetical protein